MSVETKQRLSCSPVVRKTKQRRGASALRRIVLTVPLVVGLMVGLGPTRPAASVSIAPGQFIKPLELLGGWGVVQPNGGPPALQSQPISSSPTFRYLAFVGVLLPLSDQPAAWFVDLDTGVAEEVPGALGAFDISTDGRFLTYVGLGDFDHPLLVFLKDRLLGTVEIVSQSTAGTLAAEGGLDSFFGTPSVSDDGRFVAFTATSDLTDPGCTKCDDNDAFPGPWGRIDAYLRDRTLNSTMLLSGLSPQEQISQSVVTSDGLSAYFVVSNPAVNGFQSPGLYRVNPSTTTTTQLFSHQVSGVFPSANGSKILVNSSESIDAQDTDGVIDAYVFDSTAASLTLVSPLSAAYGAGRALSPNGRFVLGWEFFADLTTGVAYHPFFYTYMSELFATVRDDAAIGFLVSREPLLYRPTFGAPPNPDADGDGVDDGIDTGVGAFTDASLTPPTVGSIGSVPAGLIVRVTDEAAPDGVRVVVTGTAGPTDRVELSVCGFTVRMATGGDAVFTCGSIMAKVITGPVVIDLGDGTTVTLTSGATAKVSQVVGGGYTVENLTSSGTGTVTIATDGLSSAVAPGASVPLRKWVFAGFDSPVRNAPTVNTARGGQTVALKWRLTDVAGQAVTTLSTVSMQFVVKDCTTGAVISTTPQSPTGGSGLQNLGNGNYQVNWKTPKIVAPCGELSLDIGQGVPRVALLQLR